MPAYRTRDTQSRHLEVTTDAPLPPQVSIISPTPRAFTFPILDNPSYASPSNSPFELDLKSHTTLTPPPLRTLSPTSSIGSETSSALSTPSATSSQVSHRRRRSTVSDNERRPKKGDEDYVKRPENAFILFRRKCCEERQLALDETSTLDDGTPAPAKRQRQADLSKQISREWKALSAPDREYWENLAKEKKKEHEEKYPGYVYRPQRVPKGKGKKGKGKQQDGEPDAEDSISFVLPLLSPQRSPSRGHGHGRRAASAPTPPPVYQTVQLPTVYMPSCPSSPMLIPRISRRTPAPASFIPPPTGSDPSTHFEYLPHDAQLPPAFQRSNFETDLPCNDSYQIYNFNGQQAYADKSAGVPLQAIHIPRDSTFYMSSNMMSPADSIASSLLSPADSIGSSISPTSPHGAPFTPGEALSMSDLSINRSGDPNAECIPDNGDADLQSYVLGFGGYSWQGQSLWSQASEPLMPSDFDINAIPPVEIGLPMSGEPEDSDVSFGYMQDNNVYSDPNAPDPFASLFENW